jgi:hypothetical protein
LALDTETRVKLAFIYGIRSMKNFIQRVVYEYELVFGEGKTEVGGGWHSGLSVRVVPETAYLKRFIWDAPSGTLYLGRVSARGQSIRAPESLMTCPHFTPSLLM